MRRFITIGLAAIFAMAAAAVSTTAHASAGSTPPLKLNYGTLWSKDHLAKVSGYVDERGSSASAVFKLWDLDKGGKCAYLKIHSVLTNGKAGPGKTFKKCGTDHYRKIDFRLPSLNDNLKEVK